MNVAVLGAMQSCPIAAIPYVVAQPDEKTVVDQLCQFDDQLQQILPSHVGLKFRRPNYSRVAAIFNCIDDHSEMVVLFPQ